jgi:hypothetical protein
MLNFSHLKAILVSTIILKQDTQHNRTLKTLSLHNHLQLENNCSNINYSKVILLCLHKNIRAET